MADLKLTLYSQDKDIWTSDSQLEITYPAVDADGDVYEDQIGVNYKYDYDDGTVKEKREQFFVLSPKGMDRLVEFWLANKNQGKK